MLTKKSLFLISMVLTIPVIVCFSQSVSVSGDFQEPHPSSILDVISTDKGLLLPRMTTDQRNAINDPAESLIIFNTDNKCFETYIEGVWHSWWCAEEEFDCDGTINYQGYDYQIVQIGNQCWFAENLRYDDGCSSNAWVGYTDVGWCGCYDEQESNCNTHGMMYQWSAAMNGNTTEGTQGLCPDGWHLPTDNEIKILEMYLGMSQIEADNTGYRGTNEGSKLAGNVSLWSNGTLNQDPEFGVSGFSVLPSGIRLPGGTFNNIGTNAYWWTSSAESEANGWRRRLDYDDSKINRGFGNKSYGYSVRCIRND